VIGVAERKGGMLGEDLDEFVTIPLSTHQKAYKKPGNPVNLIVSAVSLERREKAMDQVRVVLRTARRIPYEKDDDFTIMTPDAILSFINNITRAFRVLMVSLPLLSIVIGGIVIMNIMMISVTERTREIGIRKSLGARRRDVLAQFLYESLILSIVGGAVGILFGVLAGRAFLSSVLDIQVTPTVMAVCLGVGISTGVGLFFGIYPATRAARLDPIKALSFE
jgi:putative ABC transport system permease protein